MHYVIVGNGVGGIEAALVLRRKDAEARISLVSDEHDHFYSRTALMYVFAGQMRLQDTEPYDRGVYVRLGVNVEQVRRGPDGGLAAVRLGDAPRALAPGSEAGEIACDLLVSAIGVVPNTGFLADGGLRLSKGGAIEVDEGLRASAPDVWAAGD